MISICDAMCIRVSISCPVRCHDMKKRREIRKGVCCPGPHNNMYKMQEAHGGPNRKFKLNTVNTSLIAFPNSQHQAPL